MKRTKREKKLIDLATKKTIHVSMSVSSHAGFRVACFNHGISMQEAIEEYANLISMGHPDMISILESISLRKVKNQIRQMDNMDTDSIYNILELENPLKDNS